MSVFIELLQPAPVGGGFAMEEYWVWCGSVVEGEDGRYHMFASRWPKALAFTPHWVTNSEIVRASADLPEGPYRFEEIVLGERDPAYWDGRMAHNPTVQKHGDTYLLYYIGSTYEEERPSPANPLPAGPLTVHSLSLKARCNQRVGVAIASSVYGPWIRPDTPILQPRPGHWDGLMMTNPAPCVRPDGSVLLVYKSTACQGDLLRLGAAWADRYDGEYRRLKEEPIFTFDDTGDHVEDPFIWWSEECKQFELIMKDMKGGICGEKYAGIHATSPDGVNWTVSEPAKAYSRSIRWDNGTMSVQGCLERPQLLFRNGRPTHLFAATADGPGGFDHATISWNMVVPLAASNSATDEGMDAI